MIAYELPSGGLLVRVTPDIRLAADLHSLDRRRGGYNVFTEDLTQALIEATPKVWLDAALTAVAGRINTEEFSGLTEKTSTLDMFLEELLSIAGDHSSELVDRLNAIES